MGSTFPKKIPVMTDRPVIWQLFDELSQTKYFSSLYADNKKLMDDLFEEKGGLQNCLVMLCSLSYPCRVGWFLPMQPCKKESLIWKVDAFRLFGQ